jgi:uncharacterized membrane protein
LGYWRDGKEVKLPASRLSLVQRPPPAVVGIMLAVPATVPLLFSLFCLTFMLRRLTCAKAFREQTKLKATSALKHLGQEYPQNPNLHMQIYLP